MTYDVWIERDAHDARSHLPGHVRQRIGRLIDELANDPRPNLSNPLDTSDLAVRKRPPYDYEDLDTLTARLE